MCAAVDMDDLEADVLYDVFYADWTLGVWRRGDVGVGQKVCVIFQESICTSVVGSNGVSSRARHADGFGLKCCYAWSG
jgi:hypothetical protein